MSNPYRELFQAPGALGFVLAGAIARLPLPMIGIGIITMLSWVIVSGLSLPEWLIEIEAEAMLD